MKEIELLPDAEFEVMKAIWNNNTPISTTQVKKYLDIARPWNISALQTLLNRLIARGFVSSEKHGKNRYYEPIILESEYLAKEYKSFLEKLNGCSITKLVFSLYENKTITHEDLKELATYIDKITKVEK